VGVAWDRRIGREGSGIWEDARIGIVMDDRALGMRWWFVTFGGAAVENFYP
jgi:hypothetical protein